MGLSFAVTRQEIYRSDDKTGGSLIRQRHVHHLAAVLATLKGADTNLMVVVRCLYFRKREEKLDMI
jgi:hypothetical protein